MTCLPEARFGLANTVKNANAQTVKQLPFVLFLLVLAAFALRGSRKAFKDHSAAQYAGLTLWTTLGAAVGFFVGVLITGLLAALVMGGLHSGSHSTVESAKHDIPSWLASVLPLPPLICAFFVARWFRRFSRDKK
jgi:uncharacterized membrane protein YfcA